MEGLAGWLLVAGTSSYSKYLKPASPGVTGRLPGPVSKVIADTKLASSWLVYDSSSPPRPARLDARFLEDLPLEGRPFFERRPLDGREDDMVQFSPLLSVPGLREVHCHSLRHEGGVRLLRPTSRRSQALLALA